MSLALLKLTEGALASLLPGTSKAVLQGLTDASLTALWAVFFGCVVHVFQGVVAEPLARAACVDWSAKGKIAPTKEEEATIVKFTESLWKATVYTTFAGLAVWVLHDEVYWYDTRHFWTGCGDLPCLLPKAEDHRLLYSVELGFYIFSIPYLLFFESKRKDFLVMLLHHACTSLLILLSFALNFMRVGLAIMFLHDVCDIFLETAKVWNYTTKHTGRPDTAAGVMFGVFTVVWVLMRCVYFPFWCIWSVLFESLDVMVEDRERVPRHIIIIYGFSVLLIGLQLMHIYWTYLISIIAFRKLAYGVGRDIREE